MTDSKTDVPVLELRNLSKNFGGLKATRDVSFRVMSGDRKAIIGPNGAGKTTLFNLITGIYPVSSGQVMLFGRDVTKWRSHHRTALARVALAEAGHVEHERAVVLGECR